MTQSTFCFTIKLSNKAVPRQEGCMNRNNLAHVFLVPDLDHPIRRIAKVEEVALAPATRNKLEPIKKQCHVIEQAKVGVQGQGQISLTINRGLEPLTLTIEPEEYLLVRQGCSFVVSNLRLCYECGELGVSLGIQRPTHTLSGRSERIFSCPACQNRWRTIEKPTPTINTARVSLLA